jgi:hypothetical protein
MKQLLERAYKALKEHCSEKEQELIKEIHDKLSSWYWDYDTHTIPENRKGMTMKTNNK